ncbi:methyl-accepting chemotaxis protein [Sporomusa acidovorans]|uniref:Uncharacterized protein n=1 Tax=Sporomusa acidovorans (strain ATCC 49682 / DSM 3132 / Mol) TaxID=1123286 RepID=A0ABZ3J8X7_SPOA4|nr:methyl-accepting chemotaxis protein [Sporomusa acidovorans]OZC16638.1 methyl-accepting chemotaxis protein IV [Sporomusa acidovorans DSM 3132]SDE07538.1 methyl-accepting chemotaxis sensory transducer [Sporomusa acidovorans]
MQWFYNLKIRNKLVAAFIAVALLAGIVGFIGIYNIKDVQEKYVVLYEDYGVAGANIGQLGVALEQSRSHLRDILLAKGSADRSRNVAAIKELDKEIDERLPQFEKSIKGNQVREEFKELRDNIEKFRLVRDKVMVLALANQEDQAVIVMRNEGAGIVNAIDELVDKLYQDKVNLGRQVSKELIDQTNRVMVVLTVIIAVAIALALGLGVAIALTVSRPLQALAGEMKKMAEGDLNVAVNITSKDEIGMLAGSFTTMAANINEVINNINLSSAQVSAGSRQMSASSLALSQGATEQASSIEEVTASMEQIAAQTTQNAVNANQANELAITTQENAEQGNSKMQHMLTAMEDINSSAASISKIIKVIDEIAFQTNILALNAAVEAARAGQHGKGFAVVAEEVRNLAARSANAAKETTVMIEGSIQKANLGTQIAQETAASLNKIVHDIEQVAELVGQIAAASNEQASGISQVNQAINQVSQVVQSNSATAEESAAASEELSAQADTLKDLVGKFKVKRTAVAGGLGPVDPATLKLIQDMLDKQKAGGQTDMPKSKVKIVLSDNEFGKY